MNEVDKIIEEAKEKIKEATGMNSRIHLSLYNPLKRPPQIETQNAVFDLIVARFRRVTGCGIRTLQEQDRTTEVSNYRKMFVALCYAFIPRCTSTYVGFKLNRNHSSILNLKRKHEDHMDAEPIYADEYNNIFNSLKYKF